jgi:hypothetical protein
MPTTTNYGWTTPADTDLVKDGAAAIRTLGSSIDTTVFANASAGIPKTIVDAKGDLIAGTASDTVARLAIGANDQVLTADSSTATGMKWAAAGGGGGNYSLLNTGGTALSGSATVTVSGISGMEKLMVVVIGARNGVAYNPFYFRINGDSGTNYVYAGNDPRFTSSPSQEPSGSIADTSILFAQGDPSGSTTTNYGAMFIDSGKSTGFKYFSVMGGGEWKSFNKQGIYKGSAAITSITVFTGTSMNAGTVYVYGSAA